VRQTLGMEDPAWQQQAWGVRLYRGRVADGELNALTLDRNSVRRRRLPPPPPDLLTRGPTSTHLVIDWWSTPVRTPAPCSLCSAPLLAGLGEPT
jgi:hypothetical protein